MVPRAGDVSTWVWLVGLKFSPTTTTDDAVVGVGYALREGKGKQGKACVNCSQKGMDEGY